MKTNEASTTSRSSYDVCRDLAFPVPRVVSLAEPLFQGYSFQDKHRRSLGMPLSEVGIEVCENTRKEPKAYLAFLLELDIAQQFHGCG